MIGNTLKTWPGLAGWRSDQIAIAILTAALLAMIMVTYGRYGFTTDEYNGFERASRVFAFLRSVGSDIRVANFGVANFYGAAPDALGLLLQKLVPFLSYDARHLVFAWFGVVGILYVYKFGSRFASPLAGIFAALFLATMPMWFGYMFINHKDIPFAAMLIASSYYGLVALTAPEAPRLLWLKLGLTIGLLATIKIVGIPILGFVVLVFLCCFMLFPSEHRVELDSTFFHRVAAMAASALGGILICSLLFWPQLYLFRPDQLFHVVTTFLNFNEWNGTTLIFQTVYKADETPWYYASVYFLISTPLYLLALSGIGIACAIYRRAPAIIASAVAFLFVFAAQAVTGAVNYGGCRHFLFVYPFFAMLAAYPAALMLDTVKHQLTRLAFIGAIGLCVSATILEMYRLFPYQYSFYNSLVGGFAGADGKFHIDVWRSAEREALDQIEGLSPGKDKVRVFSPGGSQLNFWVNPRLERVERNEDADYIVALRRICSSESLWHSCPVDAVNVLPAVGEVRREGVLLARIYAVRPRSLSERVSSNPRTTHTKPTRPGTNLVQKKDRKKAAAVTSGVSPTPGDNAAAKPSRTPKPPTVMVIRFESVTTGRTKTACQLPMDSTPTIKNITNT
jgi:hypothetical protein